MARGRGTCLRRFVAGTVLGIGLTAPVLAGQAPVRVEDRVLETWRWRSYGEDNGLPSAHVLRLAVDGGGTLWAGTSTGIAWFDGYRFLPVPTDGVHLEVGFETILRLLPVDEDRVYVELEGGRRLLAGRGGLTDFPFGDAEDGWRRCEPDGEGGFVLFRGRNGDLPAGIEWVRGPERVEVPLPDPRLAERSYARILHAGGGHLWLVDGDRLHHLHNGHFDRMVPLGPDQADCMAVVGDSSGELLVGWCRTRKDDRRSLGVLPYRWTGERWVEMSSGGFVHDLVAARQLPTGEVLACYKGGRFELLRDGTWRELLNRPLDLIGIRDFVVGAEGELVFATTGGLRACYLDLERWKQMRPGYEQDGFGILNQVLEDGLGNLWCAGHRLHELRPDGSVVLHRLPSQEPDGQSRVLSLALDDRGRVLATTWIGGGGTWCWDGEQWSRLLAEDGDLPARLLHMDRTADGRVWLFAMPHARGAAGGAGGTPVWTLARGMVERWLPGAALEGQQILAMAMAPDGSLWFGGDRGLSCYRSGSWRHWRRRADLPNQAVESVAIDARGRCWFTCENRAGYIDEDNRLQLPFEEGPAGNMQVQVLAGGPDGMLCLGGPTKLLCGSGEGWFPIDLPPDWVGTPPNLLHVGRQGIYVGAARSGLFRLRTTTDRDRPPVVVGPQVDVRGTRVDLRWRLCSYQAAEAESNLLARYRLDDGPWSDWKSRRELVLDDLSRGRHVIELQARSLFSGTGPVTALAPFEVRLPVAEDPLVRSVFFALTAGLLVLLALWVRQIRARQLEASAGRTRLETLTNAAQVGILHTDLSGRVLFGNRRGRELLRNGTRREGPQTIFDGLHPDDADRVRAEWQRAVTAAGPFRAEFRYRPSGSEPRWVVGQAEPERDAEGRVLGYVGSLTDITSSKQAEEERSRLARKLQEIHKLDSVGKLAGGVAHDFNNLLQIVLGSCEQLQDRDIGVEAQKDLVRVRHAAERATELTRKLLAFGRKQELPASVADLGALVLSLQPILRSLMPENVELVIRTPETPARVFIDPGTLEQVVFNLCLNARDAMPEGGSVSLLVDVVEVGDVQGAAHAWVAGGLFVRLSVRDRGRGMSQELLSRVFEPFFTTKAPGKGTGLGLAVVYGIVRQAGGFVEVDSTPGSGSEFRVHLPLHEAEYPTDVEPEAAGIVGGTETLLVAEDEAHIRELMVRVLEREGYEVIEAEDGADALAKFEQNRDRIDLMVLDVVMPGLGGRDVVERLSVRGPRPAFLFSSGYSLDQLSPEFLAQRRIEILPKPWRAGELLAKVREALDRDRGPA